MNRPARCLVSAAWPTGPPCVTVIETTVLKKPIAAPTDPHTSSNVSISPVRRSWRPEASTKTPCARPERGD